MHPNIFHHATSELSQDAFLAYLIEWADPKYANDTSGMHQAGTLFLQHLLKQLPAGIKPLTINVNAPFKKVKAICQKSNIDVLVNLHYVNGDHLTLVIEDKIHAGDYNDLKDYVTRSGSIEGCHQENIKGLFLKTGEQFSYEKATSAEYSTFLRADFMAYFKDVATKKPIIEDAIFVQWKQQFEARQERLTGWENNLVTEWEDEQFIGFYQHLTTNWIDENGNSLVDGWSWVNPPSKAGFYGLWSRMIELPGTPWRAIYLQIQRNELVIRTSIDSDDGKERSAHRNQLYQRLVELGLVGKAGSLEMVKPDNFGNGRTMEICRLGYPSGWGSAELTAGFKERYKVLLREVIY